MYNGAAIIVGSLVCALLSAFGLTLWIACPIGFLSILAWYMTVPNE